MCFRFTERLIPPEFFVKLVDKEAIEEDHINFVCEVRGKPLPEITWWVCFVLLLHTYVGYRLLWCAAENAQLTTLHSRSLISAIAMLQRSAMYIISPNQSTLYLDLFCHRLRNDVEMVADGKRIKTQCVPAADKYELTASLSIESASMEDTSEITAVARNVAGRDVTSGRLLVKSELTIYAYLLVCCAQFHWMWLQLVSE